ncbi:MAG: hypothetical protein Q9168_006688 [Polycauliona sp. 1 TL-2023]
MNGLDQTLSMPAEQFDDAFAMVSGDTYDYDGPFYPDPTDFGMQFDNTVNTMDFSAGADWQPMGPPESNTTPYAFTNKAVVFPPQALDYFDPNSYAPFSPEVPQAAAPELFDFAAAEYQLSRYNQQSGGVANSLRQEPKRQTAKPKKTYQPPIEGAGDGCTCGLCTGNMPVIDAAYLASIGGTSKTANFRSRKRQSRVAKGRPAKKRGRPSKRPEREVTPELASSLSELDEDSEDGEYRPAPAKRQKVSRYGTRKVARSLPRGLEIDMNGWQ